MNEEEFSAEKTDSIVIYVEELGSPIELKGKLDMTTGVCNFIVKAPATDTLFLADTSFKTETIYTVDRIHLNDTLFSADSVFITDTLLFVDTIFSIDTIPLYDTIYKKSFKSENSFTIDETFNRVLGKWTFIYQLKKMDNTLPEGSLDFIMKYDD